MNVAITRLKEIFSENRVSSFSDFRKLSPDLFKRLDASIYGWFSSFRQDNVKYLAEADGLNMCLGLKRSTEEFAIGAPMEMVVKKLSFFSQTGVILTPKFSAPGKSNRAVPDSWYYLVLNYLPLIETGALMVLPKAVACLVKGRVGGICGAGFVMGGRVGNVNQDWFLLEEEIPSIRVINLSEKALCQQLVEAHAHYGVVGNRRAYIYMPHLANVSVELLCSLRQHHGDVFARYNRTIQSFFSGSTKAKSEKQLLEVMKATDEGIRRIDAELRNIAKSRTIQTAKVAVISSAGILCECINNEILKGTAKFLTAGSLIPSALNYFDIQAQKKAIQEKTPFYFPWLIHREAVKLVPK